MMEDVRWQMSDLEWYGWYNNYYKRACSLYLMVDVGFLNGADDEWHANWLEASS